MTGGAVPPGSLEPAEVNMHTRFLVATDGTPSAEGALRIALELHRRGRGEVEVVSVVEPAPSPVPPLGGFGVRYLDLPDLSQHARRDTVAGQVAALGPDADDWPVFLEIGPPGPTIARVAAERGAGLILLGLRPHGRLERLLRSETALSVIHLTPLPVLAVAPASVELPRRVLVAVDFLAHTTRALHALLPLLGREATIHLAHVGWPRGPERQADLEDWRRTYLYGVSARLEEIASQLWLDADVPVVAHVATGDPEEELLALAERLHVQLIAAGSHGYGLLRRAMLRSVSTGLIRHAPCSVLLTHAADGPEEESHASAPAAESRLAFVL